jgi:hypothetical protein
MPCRFLNKSILIIVSIIPVFYAIGRIYGESLLYGVKDLIFPAMFIFLIVMRFNYYLWISVLLLAVINIYALALVTQSYVLYLLSIREFFFYPVFGMLLGYFLFKKEGVFPIFRISFFYLLFTYLFLLFFPEASFGSTNRLHALWDGEHEPGIIGAIVFLGALTLLKKTHLRNLILLLSVGLILMSGSRSIFMGLAFGLFVIYLREFSAKKIIFLILLSFIVINIFDSLTISGRALDHNLHKRMDQYVLAYDMISNSNYLGIGPDKYGAVSGVARERYCLNERCTTTMDSSLIKYLVNYGVFFAIVLLGLLIFCVILFFKNRGSPMVTYFLSIISFCLVVGSVTGKLGAFPMNLFFYMAVGSGFYLLIPKRGVNE